MAYRDFDGKNNQMLQRWIAVFLYGKGQILWDVMVNTAYVHPINFLAPELRDLFDANMSTTCFVLCVNPNLIGFRQRT
jgi:hypothetical protein